MLLASLGDTREWVMVAFDGMLAQAPSAVTGTLPPDTAIDRLVCDPSGQRCLFSQVSTLTPDPESASHHLVDVSGTSAGEPIWLLDAAPAEIVWFGEAHAVIHANDAAEVHVVDASAGAPQVHTIAPGVTVNEVIGLDPEHDRVLFVADAGAGTQLWRASIDGSSLAPIVPTHRWLDADGWYVHEVAVID